MRMVRGLPTGSFGNGYGVPAFHEGCKRKRDWQNLEHAYPDFLRAPREAIAAAVAEASLRVP